MNKKTFFTAMAGAVLLASCQTTRKGVTSSAIEGEWNITEVESSAVKALPAPYIGFDTKANRIYGNSGCNLISGMFDFKRNKGKIEMGHMASTMMACPNMELEQSVLRALGSVERISSTDKEHLTLCDKDKNPLLKLEKRFRIVPISDIKGEWRIVSVFGENMAAMEEVPFVNFDMDNSRVNAFAGCNRISGSYKTGEKPNELTISNVASTRMACPDMTTEQNVVNALSQVHSFGILMNGNLALFSTGGHAVMELMRNK